MWFLFNRVINSVEPKKVIGLSATIDKSLDFSLFSGSRFDVRYEELPFSFDSVLKMIIFDKPFEFEKRKLFLDQIANTVPNIMEKDKGLVILCTSFEDIRFLHDRLKDDFKVVSQFPETDKEKITKEYEEKKADILIGNKSFWEGINIKRDSVFIITKMPYLSPEDADFYAVESYSDTNSFLINKKEALITLIQGLGRVIRKNGEEKKVYIFDNRIKDFPEIPKEIPAVLLIAKIKEDEKINLQPDKLSIPQDIKKQFYYSFKDFQSFILKEKKLSNSELSIFILNNKELDKKMAKFFGLNYPRERKDTLYSKFYTNAVADFIRIYTELGIEPDPEYIAQKLQLSEVYVRKVLKSLKT